jgi:hypothetical protein
VLVIEEVIYISATFDSVTPLFHISAFEGIGEGARHARTIHNPRYLPKELPTPSSSGSASSWLTGSFFGSKSVSLNDFDRIEPDNADTSLLFDAGDEGSYKTRVCCRWLEAHGFRTRLIERPFDSNFRCRSDEPRLALCGFDSNEVRRELATAEFLRAMESGLGGTADNFDTISFHTLPNPRSIEELWPVPTADEKHAQAQELERMARENPAYARLDDNDCGRAALAGKSVAVPFVGAAVATIVLAEAIRLLHGGPAYTDTSSCFQTSPGDSRKRSATIRCRISPD